MVFPTQSLAGLLTPIAIYPALITLVIILVSFLPLKFLGFEDVEPQEPPVVRSRMPLVGHLIGLLKHHNNYFTMLRYICPYILHHNADEASPSQRYSGPIFTVKIFSSRIYIIQSPELAQAAFRQSKEIDFSTIKVWGCRAIEYNEHATGIVAYDPPKGEGSYMTDLHQEMHSSLAQGPNLIKTNARLLNCLARSLNSIHTKPTRHQLFRWLRDEYTIGSAETLYGVPNPVSEDPSLIHSIW